MTIKQRLLKAFYPVLMRLARSTGKHHKFFTSTTSFITAPPLEEIRLADRSKLSPTLYQGKKILLVNTASDCGYTAQLGELQLLQEQHANNLLVIGFPSNDFKEQEKNNDAVIGAFCQKNYGVQFPIAAKTKVIAAADQNELFQWLSDAKKNGWNNKAPNWNFCKYLLDEQGNLCAFGEAGVAPGEKELADLIRKR